MANARPMGSTLQDRHGAEPHEIKGLEDLYLLALPLATFRKLSDFAANRNMTVAKVLATAIEDFLGKGEQSKLLVESDSSAVPRKEG